MTTTAPWTLTVGVLALQGAFYEHIQLFKAALSHLVSLQPATYEPARFTFLEVRTEDELSKCQALVIPGGESTTMSLVAARGGLLEPLRDFVKVDRKPTWGTCAGMILLAEAANSTKKGGQELVGGLDVRVNRNHFGRQIESFVADLELPFLAETGDPTPVPFPGVFIRAPVVEKVLPNVDGIQEAERQLIDSVVAPSKVAKDTQARSMMSAHVEIMGVLPGRLKKAAAAGAKIDAGDEAGDIIAVKQGNVFGTSFHPELTGDVRIHAWWLQQVLAAYSVEELGERTPV